MRVLSAIIWGTLLLVGCSSQRRSTVVTLTPPNFVYVDGNVNKHGRYDWTNGMTLQDAIDMAGGLNEFSTRHLRIMHWDRSVEIYRLTEQLTLTNNPLLEPGDKIYSPRQLF